MKINMPVTDVEHAFIEGQHIVSRTDLKGKITFANRYFVEVSGFVDKIDEGSRLVDESGRTLEQIVTSVKKISDIVAEIAAASAEQSSGIDQVNGAITQMDQMTQQNTALVEQATAASESMGDQARNLNKLMTFFSLDHGEEALKSMARHDEPEGFIERRNTDQPWAKQVSTGHNTASMSIATEKKRMSSPGDEVTKWEAF